jgi:hypothetical protein
VSDQLIRDLLGDPAPDPGCDSCLEWLAAWADATCRGDDADREYPGVATHLRNCDACREDAEGLIARLQVSDT